MNSLEIRAWFNDGKQDGASFMIVVHDALNAFDYPIFVKDPSKVEQTLVDARMAPMQRLLEVYNLNEDRNDQLDEVRCWRLPDDSNSGGASAGD